MVGDRFVDAKVAKERQERTQREAKKTVSMCETRHWQHTWKRLGANPPPTNSSSLSVLCDLCVHDSNARDPLLAVGFASGGPRRGVEAEFLGDFAGLDAADGYADSCVVDIHAGSVAA